MSHGIFIEVLNSDEVVASDGDLLPLLGPLLTGQVLGFGADDADVLKILGAVGGAGPDGGFVFPAAGPVAALLAGGDARHGAVDGRDAEQLSYNDKL